MGRRRGGRPIHGWLVIDKPAGMTSAQVVAKARRLTGAARIGHGGTLDPLATGLLPLALGEATKTVSYVMDGAKTYRFTIRWGEERSTDDAEGEVTKTGDIRPTEAQILEILPEFTGVIRQVPPAFSAIKVAGKRAFALARADQPVDLAPREVRIDNLTLLGIPDTDHAEFEVSCGKGTYVRSLARDIARRLGTAGHVAALRRTRVGPFLEKDAISLELLESLGHSAPLTAQLHSVETALDGIPALPVTEIQAGYLRNGRPVRLSGTGRDPEAPDLAEGAILFATSEGTPVALARFLEGEIRPVRVLNL